MASIEHIVDDEEIQELLWLDRRMAVLLTPTPNQILQAEMTRHPADELAGHPKA